MDGGEKRLRFEKTGRCCEEKKGGWGMVRGLRGRLDHGGARKEAGEVGIGLEGEQRWKRLPGSLL